MAGGGSKSPLIPSRSCLPDLTAFREGGDGFDHAIQEISDDLKIFLNRVFNLFTAYWKTFGFCYSGLLSLVLASSSLS